MVPMVKWLIIPLAAKSVLILFQIYQNYTQKDIPKHFGSGFNSEMGHDYSQWVNTLNIPLPLRGVPVFHYAWVIRGGGSINASHVKVTLCPPRWGPAGARETVRLQSCVGLLSAR